MGHGSKWYAAALAAVAVAVLWVGVSKHLHAVSAGAVTVIDGDTLTYDGVLIDLPDIDAPELGQWCLDGSHAYQCGLEAAFDLKKRLSLEPVKCARTDAGWDRAECITPNGSLSVLLAEDGLVVARSDADVAAAAARAREVPLGIWRGDFVDPADWRTGERLPEEATLVEPCPILAVREDDEPGYVVPTDPGYEAWLAEPSRITARFCSDEAARAAGYRHAASRPGGG